MRKLAISKIIYYPLEDGLYDEIEDVSFNLGSPERQKEAGRIMSSSVCVRNGVRG